MFNWDSRTAIETYNIYPDDTYAIDFILDGSTVKKIYDAWDEDKNGQLVDYGGGTRAITARMLLGAGQDFLQGIKGIGKIRAGVVLAAVKDAAAEVPYGDAL